MKTYIVILNYNSWQDTIESTLSVINGSRGDYQIIILDNHSNNDSQAMIQKWLDGKYSPNQSSFFYHNKSGSGINGPFPYVLYGQGRYITRDPVIEQDALDAHERINGKALIKFPVIVIQTGENLGFAGGNNVALRSLVDSDEQAFILLMNPDVVLKPDALSQLHESYASMVNDPFVSGLSIMNYRQPDKKLSVGGVKIFKPIGLIQPVTDYAQEVDYIYGGALFTNTHTFRQVGLLPEEYFLYWEETDWCTKAKRFGVPFYLCRKAICYDKIGASIGRGFVSEYFFTRNSFYYYKKYYPHYRITLFLFQIIRLFIKLTKTRTDLAKGIIFALTDVISGRKRNVIK